MIGPQSALLICLMFKTFIFRKQENLHITARCQKTALETFACEKYFNIYFSKKKKNLLLLFTTVVINFTEQQL